MQSSDRALANDAIASFKERRNWPAKPGSSDEVWVQPFALLARKLTEVCPSEPAKYTSLAHDLSTIAVHFGLGSPRDRERGRMDISAETIRRARNDMAQGKSRSEAAPLLCWLWLTHRAAAIDLFGQCGYDYASVIARIEAESAPATDRVLVAAQNRNKFDLSYLLENAKDRIILVAQNHWHLISQPEGSRTDFWPKIESAIRRGVIVEIVAMHPDGPPALRLEHHPDAIDLWTVYMKAPAFRDHVALCWKTLSRFAQAFDDLIESGSGKRGHGTLNLYRAYFVPMTITIVDPLSVDGMAVVSPRTANEVSGTRPEFVLRRSEHLDPFLYYWSFVENGLANQGWEKV